jgi:Ice-binding-like
MLSRLLGRLSLIAALAVAGTTCKSDPTAEGAGDPFQVQAELSSINVGVGGSATFAAWVVDIRTNRLQVPLTFASCNGAFATVAMDATFDPVPPTSAKGVVTGVQAGTTCVVVSSSGLKPDTVTVVVLISGTGTGGTDGHGPSLVPLGTAGSYVILAKSGISNVPMSAITGDLGVSPVTATAITGLPLTLDGTGTFATTPEVTGKVYAANYVSPTPDNLITAISDMETAYTAAAGLTNPDHTELASGNLGGLTLAPGLYKWSNTVTIPSDVTLSGGANDTWVFQIAGGITQSSATHVNLSGGALAHNVLWQATGVVDIGTTAHMEGVILSHTSITVHTGATVNGRLLAQTAVTLDGNTIVQK